MIFQELGSVYDGPIVQTHDLTAFNITKKAIITRQVKQFDQYPPIPGKQRVNYTLVAEKPPEWWAKALIPFD